MKPSSTRPSKTSVPVTRIPTRGSRMGRTVKSGLSLNIPSALSRMARERKRGIARVPPSRSSADTTEKL